jgi:hypothetical protein
MTDFSNEATETEEEKPTLVLVKSESGSESNGARPKKPKGLAKCGSKTEPTETKQSREVKVKASQLRAKAEAGDNHAKVALGQITDAYLLWNKAKLDRKEVSKECKERAQAAEASFTHAIELPINTNGLGMADGLVYQEKLERVEQSWQDWSEVKAHNVEEKKAAHDALKAAQETLNRVIVDSSQLALPGMQ